MVLPQYELVPKLEFVCYYYQLVLVRYTCIARMSVHCTHEILVVCALCFYMWSFLDSNMWQNLVKCKVRRV